MQSSASPADLMLRFFRYLDDQNYDRVPALFSEDGIWHRRGVATIGPDGVARSLAEIPPVAPSFHLMTNLLIDTLSPDEAQAVCYLTVFRSENAPHSLPPPWAMEPPLSFALCKAEMARDADAWRFRMIRTDILFRR